MQLFRKTAWRCARGLSLGLPQGPALPLPVCTPETPAHARAEDKEQPPQSLGQQHEHRCTAARPPGDAPRHPGRAAGAHHRVAHFGEVTSGERRQKGALSGTAFTGSPKRSKLSPAAVLDRGSLGLCRETCGVSQREGVEAGCCLAPYDAQDGPAPEKERPMGP